MGDLLLALDNVSVVLQGRQVLTGISFILEKGAALAVTGASGSGKSVLAGTLAGRHFYQGSMRCASGDLPGFQRQVQVVAQQHRFRSRNQLSDQYYQQRFNTANAGEILTVAEALAPYDQDAGLFSKDDLLDLFGFRKLLAESLIQLSSGESKRLQILRAMLTGHELLVLDQPYTGLDEAGRVTLTEILRALHTSGESIILITGVRDLPSFADPVLLLEEGKMRGPQRREIFPGEPPGALSSEAAKIVPGAANGWAAGTPVRFPLPADGIPPAVPFAFALRLRNVSVRYEGRVILDQINWEVKRGACWGLSGPNGAGKSTLLSLITGDNPQAYANDIEIFDRPRGSGESIWDIKRSIGLLSPELQLFFDPAATVYAAIGSGFFDTIGLFRQLSVEQDRLIREWAALLGLTRFLERMLGLLPAGAQRLSLLARAFIKTPPLLVLDEPCQGLDEAETDAVKTLIDQYCAGHGATLIYVSHYPSEWPSCVRHELGLENGRVAFIR